MKLLPIAFALLPLALSTAGALRDSPLLMALTVPLLFVMVGVLPFCRKRENLYMFVYASVALIPVNIRLSALPSDVLSDGKLLLVIERIIICFMLMAAEEIVLGLIARRIWRRQYKLPDLDLI